MINQLKLSETHPSFSQSISLRTCSVNAILWLMLSVSLCPNLITLSFLSKLNISIILHRRQLLLYYLLVPIDPGRNVIVSSRPTFLSKNPAEFLFGSAGLERIGNVEVVDPVVVGSRDDLLRQIRIVAAKDLGRSWMRSNLLFLIIEFFFFRFVLS